MSENEKDDDIFSEKEKTGGNRSESIGSNIRRIK